MSHFSLDTSFRQIFAEPCFASWQHMIDYRRCGADPWVDDVTLRQYHQQRPDWNVPLMLEGLEYLYTCSQKHPVFYPIYDTAEDGKDLTGLAAFPVEKKSKFVLIIPGGAYCWVCSLLDGYSYAKALNEMGYAAFVLSYRVAPHGQSAPQEDLAQAIRFILEHAEQFNLDTEGYAVMGFSAGGHLAGSLGVAELGYRTYDLPKPGSLFLCYPVITMGEFAHSDSRANFLGAAHQADPELIRRWSLEKQVTADYPPTFLWQCEGDPLVDVTNSRLMAQAFRDQGVAHEFEVFPYPTHGLPMQSDPHAAAWLRRAVEFWEKHRG